MTPLDPITRDRLIGLLTAEFENCLADWSHSSPTRLAIVALNCLETAPELLDRLNHLAKQAIKSNTLIAIAHATLPDNLQTTVRSPYLRTAQLLKNDRTSE